MNGLQDTSNRTFREIVGNGVRLEVPRFQRDYSWEAHHWSDLWDDISLAADEDEWHYLGFVVLQRRGDNESSVIDGQQRLTTLSLLVLAAMQAIQKKGGHDSAARVDALRSSYIGRQDPVTLTTSNKLGLNRNNERFYSHYLSELRPTPTTNIKASERLLSAAFKYFQDRFDAFSDGAEIARRVEFLAGRLFFTVINVTEDLNAYRVFETLNARGVQLSAADLLKNYLFSIVDGAGAHGNELDQLELRWSEILELLRRESFQNFLRAYWNSKYEKVRGPQLYREVRSRISSPREVFELLRELADAAPVYTALRDPGNEFWEAYPLVPPQLEQLEILQVRQHISLLIAGYQSLKAAEFGKLLSDTVAFSFRYNTIGGLSSGDQETLYHEVALRLRSDRVYAAGLFERLYPEDDEFKARFRAWSVSPTARGKKLARYVLGKIELQASNTQVVLGSASTTLEHILPQSPSAGWPAEDDPIWLRGVWRLGNLTLLEAAKNRQLGQSPFDAKGKVYATSAYRLTRDVQSFAQDGHWTEKSIDRRQTKLAKVASGVWRI